MNIPSDLKYTKSHEWTRKDGNKYVVGISDYAQKEISDVVFVELPKVGQEVQAGKPVAVVESVKAAFDIYASVKGKISRVNSAVEADPGLVNQNCYEDGWFFEIESDSEDDFSNLMDATAYQEVLNNESH